MKRERDQGNIREKDRKEKEWLRGRQNERWRDEGE